MRKKIMIVDDDLDILLSIKNIFEYEGYEVEVFDNGKQFYESLKKEEAPDLIILDIMMPGMTGWMLSDRLRENPMWRDIPIVFLTARTDEFARETGTPLCADYIEKPFDIEDLRERIENILE